MTLAGLSPAQASPQFAQRLARPQFNGQRTVQRFGASSSSEPRFGWRPGKKTVIGGGLLLLLALIFGRDLAGLVGSSASDESGSRKASPGSYEQPVDADKGADY